MRHLILACALSALASPAFASSIEVMVQQPVSKNDSVLAMSCTACPALRENTLEKLYTVPQVDHGRQKIEVLESAGERSVRRTESWMGGSPVVFVSKSTLWTANGNGQVMAVASDIDLGATTAAVVSTDKAASPASIDQTGLELRLN